MPGNPREWQPAARLAAIAVLIQTMIANGHAEDEEGNIVLLPEWRCIDPIVEPSDIMYSPQRSQAGVEYSFGRSEQIPHI